MFCVKCGKEVANGTKFCVSCGTELVQEAAAAVAQKTPIQQQGQGQSTEESIPVHSEPVSQKSGEIVLGQVVKLNASDENNAVIDVAGVVLKVELIFKIVSTALFVALFLPFYRINLFFIRISVNGWAAIGGPEGAGGMFWSIFFILIPVAIFVLFQFRDKLEFVKGKLFIYSTSLYAAGVLFLIIFGARVNSVFFGAVRLSAGYIISLILYIIAGAISAGCLMSERKSK